VHGGALDQVAVASTSPLQMRFAGAPVGTEKICSGPPATTRP